MTAWEQARKIVLARDGGCCLRCLDPAQHVHHRRPKGMGGTSDEYIAVGPANLVSVCFPCHDWIHSHPALAYEAGFLVKKGDDPAGIPLRVGSYSHVITLGPDGNLEETGNARF